MQSGQNHACRDVCVAPTVAPVQATDFESPIMRNDLRCASAKPQVLEVRAQSSRQASNRVRTLGEGDL